MSVDRCIIGDCPDAAPDGLCDKHRATLSKATADYFAWKGERAPKPHRKGIRRLTDPREVVRLPDDPVPLIRWTI